jgi:hypothetical protein
MERVRDLDQEVDVSALGVIEDGPQTTSLEAMGER